LFTSIRRRFGTPAVTRARGGGKAMRDVIDDVFVRVFTNDRLDTREDRARFSRAALALRGDRLAFTTDSYVDPIVFPGGDIGKLAVYGTVNALAAGGATPLYLTCSVMLEEGLDVDTVRSIATSMAQAARAARVYLVTGDAKIVEPGACEKMSITAAGIGVMRPGVELHVGSARPGDVILVNGCLGDHGATILAARCDLAIDPPVESDCAPVGELVATLLAAAPGTRFIREATHGGAATVLGEIALASQLSIEIADGALPVRDAVKDLCVRLGLDPLCLANEGKIVAVVPAGESASALAALRAHPLGREARAIGRAIAGEAGRITTRTTYGRSRIADVQPARVR
jgi:hydrogenase expression/formation protein HypE